MRLLAAHIGSRPACQKIGRRPPLDAIAARFQDAKCEGRRLESGALVASHVGNRSHAGIDFRLQRRGVRRIVLLFGRGNAGVQVLKGLVLLLHGLVRRVDGRLRLTVIDRGRGDRCIKGRVVAAAIARGAGSDRNRHTEQALEQLPDAIGLDEGGPLIARDNTVGHMRGRCRMPNGTIGGERVGGERERSDDHAATQERFGRVGSDEQGHGELDVCRLSPKRVQPLRNKARLRRMKTAWPADEFASIFSVRDRPRAYAVFAAPQRAHFVGPSRRRDASPRPLLDWG